MNDLEGYNKFLKAQLSELKEKNEVLYKAFKKKDTTCRKMQNSLQLLTGNIKVFCRVRPLNQKEKEQKKMTCSMKFINDCTIEVKSNTTFLKVPSCGKEIKQQFSFDKVYTPNASQEEVFEELPFLIQFTLQGYNVCVFAYGQAGSGKTYTMQGEHGSETEGMIPRTIRYIFNEIKQLELLGWKYRIEASFLEIYNERIIDLLDSKPKTHEIRMVDSKGEDLYVTNLTIKEIHSAEELHDYCSIGQKNRAVAATQANTQSSRSHFIVKIKLIGTHKSKMELINGNINFIDLAGSERIEGEEAVKNAKTKYINKSLTMLNNVILSLRKKEKHIPYRGCKLTYLMMPYLKRKSRTFMYLNVSPVEEDFKKTLTFLKFGSDQLIKKTPCITRSRSCIL